MISSKAFIVSCALSVLVHVLFVYVLMGYSFLSPSRADAVSGRTFQVRLVEITVPDEPEEVQKEPEQLPEAPEPAPDRPKEIEEPVLRFINPDIEKPVGAVTAPEAPRPAPPRVETPVPVYQEPESPPLLEVISAPAAAADSYWDAVRIAVAREVRYPPEQLRREKEDVIMLRIVIDASGRLVKVDAVPPRGDIALTRAALQAVQRAAPFDPPVSRGLSRDQRTAELPIRFQIRRPTR